MHVEHEYARGGAWAYLAALDIHRAKLFGRCERTTGIGPFDRLVTQVMTQSPYREARLSSLGVENASQICGDARGLTLACGGAQRRAESEDS